MNKKTFLLEIGCEELPANAQGKLSKALSEQIERALDKHTLPFDTIKSFVSPRRLAVMVSGLNEKQAPQTIEKLGPGISNAYDKTGSPTLACLGFAKSCGVTLDELTTIDTPKGQRLAYHSEKPGEDTITLLPQIITDAVSKLPLSKPMRWGNHDMSFVRPVHWVVALFGSDIVPVTLFGKAAGKETFGHRFHHPKALQIHKPEDYSMVLYSQGHVITDFDTRKKSIIKAIQQTLTSNERVIENESLLNEVTGLVEWPVVLKGKFDPAFLSVPKEALITSMETHQKCFSITDEKNNLLPNFILVSNIESKDPATVIKGNERVIQARLSDAQFFYEQDKKKTLADRLPRLDTVIFQKQLGSIGDKTKRIIKLAKMLADKTAADQQMTEMSAQLCKADLVSEMVYEFTNLQGVMGYYYAKNDGLNETIAISVQEHYLPRFSGDALPSTPEACCVAIADRIDTIVGILGINKIPTGDKDPFALRRAALGVLRIIIEKALPINLFDTISQAQQNFSCELPNQQVIQDSFDYIMTRLKSWYTEQGVSAEVFEAVLASGVTSPLDFDQRIKAVIQFQSLPEAASLAAANKRVSNILKKQAKGIQLNHTDSALFECEAEHLLAKQLADRSKVVDDFYQQANYEKALSELSTLKAPIDQFFDDVMIMVEDEKTKRNRLALLASIRDLLTKVADISLLP